MKIPSSLNWLVGETGGSDWLSALPRLIREVTDGWNLTIRGDPFSGGNVSYVVPVSRAGECFVLKLQWPHSESRHEADALKAWDGDGAICLIAHDQHRNALLLEECRPGRLLAESDVADPIGVMIELLPRLWIDAADQFRTLEAEAAQWARNLPKAWERAGQSCERKLVDAALDYICILAESQGPTILIHQDLHGHNVLSAQREPWLVIDPKPLRGEREFSLAPIVRSFEFGQTAAATIRRLDRMSEELGLDRDRALGWTVAQTMAWGFGGAYDRYHHQTVRWLLDAR